MKDKKQTKKQVLGKETIAGPVHLRFTRIVGITFLITTFFRTKSRKYI